MVHFFLLRVRLFTPTPPEQAIYSSGPCLAFSYRLSSFNRQFWNIATVAASKAIDDVFAIYVSLVSI